jgi:hypothetical protein
MSNHREHRIISIMVQATYDQDFSVADRRAFYEDCINEWEDAGVAIWRCEGSMGIDPIFDEVMEEFYPGVTDD